MRVCACVCVCLLVFASGKQDGQTGGGWKPINVQFITGLTLPVGYASSVPLNQIMGWHLFSVFVSCCRYFWTSFSRGLSLWECFMQLVLLETLWVLSADLLRWNVTYLSLSLSHICYVAWISNMVYFFLPIMCRPHICDINFYYINLFLKIFLSFSPALRFHGVNTQWFFFFQDRIR